LFGDPATFGQAGKHGRCRAAPQLWEATSRNELLRLYEELNLTDATTAELYIVSQDSNRVVALVRVDLALDGVDIGNGRIVEIFAPDIGLQLRQKPRPSIQVSGDLTRLDHRRALPVLAAAFV